MSNSKNTKCIEEKVALKLETYMQAKKLDGYPSSSLLTLLICLQWSAYAIGSYVSRDVLYEPKGRVDLISVVFSRYLSGIPSVIKIVLPAMNVYCSGTTSFKSLI